MALFNLPQPEPDPLLQLIGKYRADSRTDKVDLGVGVYRNDLGETPVLAAVKAAEMRLQEHQLTKSYLGLTGDTEFVETLGELLFGNTATVSGAQTPGGSGALRLAAEIYNLAHPDGTLWIGTPSWPNHIPLTESAGVHTNTYLYFDRNTQQILFDNLLDTIARTQPGDAFMLHGCCHNPTGADLSNDQWQELARQLAEHSLIPIIDLAYHGLGDGMAEDLASTRLIVEVCPEVLVATSCSKNFGLYRDRTGAVFMASHDKKTASIAQAVFGQIARKIYSMPPDHGAAVVRIILQDSTLTNQWQSELRLMTSRVKSLRQAMAQACPSLEFVVQQKGMFSLLPLSTAQVHSLINDHAVYLAGDGRINVAGCQIQQIDKFIESLESVGFTGVCS